MMRSSSLFIVSLLIITLSSLPFTSLSWVEQIPDDACESTEFPKLCRSMVRSYRTLPSSPDDSGMSGLGKHAIKQSLTQAGKMSKVIKHYLSPKRSRSLSQQMLGGLRDCAVLSDSTVRYLQSILNECGAGNLARLTVEEVERVQTLLSGVLANERMCFDGLKESISSIAGPLEKPLSDGNQMFRLSLRLMTQALSQNQTRHRTMPEPMFDNLAGSSSARMPLNYLIESIRKGHCNPLKNCPRRGHASSSFGDHGILVNNIVTVGKTGRNHFKSIKEAVESAPRHWRDGYHVIYVRSGVYEEYVNIPSNRRNIFLLGDGIRKTIITGNHNNNDGWGTYESASFGVDADGFMAVDITFRNTAGPNKGQAVAARVVGDLATFYRCSFEGYQDTLLNHAGRQFFRECDIYGTVDFIFGFATAAFQNCNIYTLKPLTGQATVVTAHGRRYPDESTGYTFHNCNFKPTPDLARNRRVANYLGRPWYEYSRTIIMQSYIEKHIHPRGWTPYRDDAGLNTLYYGEYSNRGPGSSTRRRVKWRGFHVLDSQQALDFTVYNFTTGYIWLPQTNIPHIGGLLSY